MAHFTGVNHLAMATGDMEATIRFWRDLLGMRLVAGVGRPGFRHYFFEISPQDMIAFFEWDGVEPLELKDHGAPVKGPFAFDHVSIGVRAEEDLMELKDRLEAAGFWVSEPINHGFIHSIYSFDPNNIAIEFSAPVEEADPRANPRLVDKDPGKVALEGPDPTPGVWPEPERPTTADEWAVYPGEGLSLLGKDTE